MKTFKQFINESTLENKIKGTLATAMLSSGMLNAMGIPVEHVPNIVHNYWQQVLAPTPEQQLTKLAAKYQHLAKKEKGQRVLDIESIPDKDDREQFMKLATGQDNENI